MSVCVHENARIAVFFTISQKQKTKAKTKSFADFRSSVSWGRFSTSLKAQSTTAREEPTRASRGRMPLVPSSPGTSPRCAKHDVEPPTSWRKMPEAMIVGVLAFFVCVSCAAWSLVYPINSRALRSSGLLRAPLELLTEHSAATTVLFRAVEETDNTVVHSVQDTLPCSVFGDKSVR